MFGFRLHRNIPLLIVIKMCNSFSLNLSWTIWPLYTQRLGATVYETSLLWGLSGLIAVLLIVPLSSLSDRVGRKPILILTRLSFIIPYYMYSVITQWEHLIPFKILAAVGWSLYQPAEMAMLADISDASTRGRIYGLVWGALPTHPIGSIIAPLVGGLLLDTMGWNIIFYASVFSAIISLIPCWFLVETRKQEGREHAPLSLSSLFALKNDFGRPMILFFLLFFFIGIQFGFSQITPIYLRDRFAASSLQQGLFFSVGTMVPALIMLPIGGWLADRWSRNKIILVSIGCSPLLLGLWPTMNTYISLLLLRTGLGVLWMILMPALMAYLMDFIRASRRGLASGISALGQQLGGTVIGTTLLGYLYTTIDWKTPFYVAAVFVLPAIPILLLLRKEK